MRCHVQEANSKAHKASKVLILGNMKMLLSTGTSRWNERQIILWDQVRPVARVRGTFVKQMDPLSLLFPFLFVCFRVRGGSGVKMCHHCVMMM